jgi:hypothetical protein
MDTELGPAGVAYDDALVLILDSEGPDRLREDGELTVLRVDRPERYNAGLWFAMKHHLRFDVHGTSMIVYAPSEG